MFYICHHAVPPTSVPSFLPQKQKTGQSGSWKESGLAWVSWESFSFLLFCVFIFKTSQLLLKFQMSFAVRTCYLTIFLHSEFLNFFTTSAIVCCTVCIRFQTYCQGLTVLTGRPARDVVFSLPLPSLSLFVYVRGGRALLGVSPCFAPAANHLPS